MSHTNTPDTTSTDVSELRARVAALITGIYERHAPRGQWSAKRLGKETEAGVFEASRDLKTDEGEDIQQLSIEAAIRTDYYHIAAQVIANLDPDAYVGNRTLIRRVASGEVAARAVGGMTPQERFPEHWAASEARLALEQSQTQRPSMTSDQFQCNRCKGRECTYYQMQTRSADEPITTFIQCMQCHNRWRE